MGLLYKRFQDISVRMIMIVLILNTNSTKSTQKTNFEEKKFV